MFFNCRYVMMMTDSSPHHYPSSFQLQAEQCPLPITVTLSAVVQELSVSFDVEAVDFGTVCLDESTEVRGVGENALAAASPVCSSHIRTA